jgi:molybdate transport system regulatory protein
VDIHFKLWIEEKDQVLFGEGRMVLLRAVAESGSLAGAARALSMSYRAAWGRIKASEQRLGFALVERSDQGRRAVKLTAKALKLMKRYQVLEEKAQEFAKQYKREWARELTRLRK